MKRAALVIVGGAATRLGGVAKPWLDVGGVPLVEHVIAAARPHVDDIIVVGAAPAAWPVPTNVRCTVEEPAGGGPVAAVRAGMELLSSDTRQVVLLAGDAPFVAPVLAQLCATQTTLDGVAAVSGGRTQYLCAVIDSAALRRALDRAGDSMRSVFDHLQIDAVEAELLDADTWEDVARLRRGSGGAMSDNRWLDEVKAMLGVEPVIDIDAVLALARDVAHNQERKNAPLTAYLLGYAAAAQGFSAAQVAETAAKLGAHAVDTGNNA